MLDDYKDNQFVNYAKNLKKYFHAYLFEVDNLEENYPLILAFAKMIICKNHYSNNKQCLDCNICHLIDENSCENLKVVEPDGISIKKEAIQSLQKEMSLKSTNDLNLVYIIKYADKLNVSSANSLLKFIEEPENGIYGILITEDRNQILSTILSRCNLISLKNLGPENFSEEEIERLINFLLIINKNKEEALPLVKTSFLDYYEKKDDIIKAFNTLEKIIDLKIQDKYQIKKITDSKIYDIIKASLNEVDILDLIKYLDKLVKFKNKLIMIPNININLFMDNFIIEMSGFEVK